MSAVLEPNEIESVFSALYYDLWIVNNPATTQVYVFVVVSVLHLALSRPPHIVPATSAETHVGEYYLSLAQVTQQLTLG